MTVPFPLLASARSVVLLSETHPKCTFFVPKRGPSAHRSTALEMGPLVPFLANIVTSKALVTTSDALVTTSGGRGSKFL